jgi:hypothetical protein
VTQSRRDFQLAVYRFRLRLILARLLVGWRVTGEGRDIKGRYSLAHEGVRIDVESLWYECLLAMVVLLLFLLLFSLLFCLASSLPVSRLSTRYRGVSDRLHSAFFRRSSSGG